MRSRAFIPRRDGPVKRKAFPWTTEKTEDPENKHTFFRFIDRYKSSLKYKDFPFTSQYLVFEFFLSIPIFYCILLLPKFGRLPAGESKCISCTKISPFCFVTFVPPPPPPSFLSLLMSRSIFLIVHSFFLLGSSLNDENVSEFWIKEKLSFAPILCAPIRCQLMLSWKQINMAEN